WRWSNPSIASQDPIDAALVPPLKRSRDVRHTLTALPALPQLSLLFRREPCPCMPLHSHTSSSAKIRRCCVDSLNSPLILSMFDAPCEAGRPARGALPEQSPCQPEACTERRQRRALAARLGILLALAYSQVKPGRIISCRDTCNSST